MRGSSRLNAVVCGGRAYKFERHYFHELITNWHLKKDSFQKKKTES